MLSKLLKYDLKAGCKIFTAMYLFIMICAIITRVLGFIGGIDSIDSNGSVFHFFYICSFMLMILCIVVSCTISLVWIILRYRNNLLRDEGYLMHTLPVTPTNLYFSKMISSIMWILADISVIFIAFIVSGVPKVLGIKWDDVMQFYVNIGTCSYNINIVIFLTLFVGFWFVALYTVLSQIFVSMNIGYTIPFGKGNSRDIMSIVVYVITYILMQVMAFVLLVIVVLISVGTIRFELMNEKEVSHYIYALFSSFIIFFSVLSAIYSTVSIRLMQKKLNLE